MFAVDLPRQTHTCADTCIWQPVLQLLGPLPVLQYASMGSWRIHALLWQLGGRLRTAQVRPQHRCAGTVTRRAVTCYAHTAAGARSTAGREGPVVGRPVRHSGSRPLLLNEILEHWVDEIKPTCLLRWSRQAGCSSSELEQQMREAFEQVNCNCLRMIFAGSSP